MSVLTINAGSSSIRFAFYGTGMPPTRLLGGKIERIGLEGTALIVDDPAGAPRRITVDAQDHSSAIVFLTDWIEAQPLFADVRSVGHRVVHGMRHASPQRVTPQLLAGLKAITPYDPEHMPREIELIETVSRRFPRLPQAACFDTAFHRSMPRVATLLPIPRRYEAKGVRRYGFHGLSYTFLMQELARIGDAAAARGRVVLAHLGNGASLAAVRDGNCIDTSMGFTPAAGADDRARLAEGMDGPEVHRRPAQRGHIQIASGAADGSCDESRPLEAAGGGLEAVFQATNR